MPKKHSKGAPIKRSPGRIYQLYKKTTTSNHVQRGFQLMGLIKGVSKGGFNKWVLKNGYGFSSVKLLYNFIAQALPCRFATHHHNTLHNSNTEGMLI